MTAYFPWFLFEPGDPLEGEPPTFGLPDPRWSPTISFEVPLHVYRARQRVTYGSPLNADIVGRIESQRLGAPLAASPTRTTPVISGGRRESRKSRRASSASRSDRSRRAHKCPKGHYWSYKHKKCVKSKF